MATLVAEEGILKAWAFVFSEGEEWVLGRDPDVSDVILDDPRVSRRHARLTETKDGYIFENLSEANPAKINDQEILGPTVLHEGDHVKIGGTSFVFLLKDDASVEQVEEEPLEPTRETIFEESELNEEEREEREEEKEEEEEKENEIILPSGRFIFKVVAGPNTGAEIVLDEGKSYLIGTDSMACDIVFNDLSVSREHARLSISKDGKITLEDLESRNGVVIDKEKISKSAFLMPNRLVSLGTSVFLVIDKEAPLETLLSSSLGEVEEEEAPSKEELQEEAEEEESELAAAREQLEEKEEQEAPVVAPEKPRAPIVVPTGALIMSLIFLGVVVLIGVGVVSLFHEKKVEIAVVDYHAQIKEALKPFSEVKFNFNERERRLLILGHVTTGVEKNELLYIIQKLPFVSSIEDNVVNDEAVSQEINIILSKNPLFKGVSLYASDPGCFVMTGYLKSTAQLSQLADFLNLNFNYLSLLKYQVIVEEEVVGEVKANLLSNGLGNVTAEFTGGLLTLTGYIPSTNMEMYSQLLGNFQKINGVKVVRNYAVVLSPESAVVDLSERYPGRYQVTGYSKHGDVSINVVINGKLYMRGDVLDGMKVESIQPQAIFLEREGLKYKIEYNK